jgi:tRNA pseudouridine55 synthase
VIVLNKPTGITSAKAVYRVRRITGVRKSGHAGTLDPGADGVLVVCLGRATKLVERVMDQPKVYRARARLDATSASFDSDHPVTAIEVASPPSIERVRAALAGFEGVIQQVPPAVSALKVGGVPSHVLARRDAAVEHKPRPVTIYWAYLHAYEWPMLDFEVCCGRGTYIRAIIRDLGAALGTGGCLTALTRSAVGPFTLDGSVTFGDMDEATNPLSSLIPLSRVQAWLAPAVDIPARPLP